MYLFQLLAVLGEWDRAQAQLKALASLSPEAQMLSVTYGQAIAAEKARGSAFAGGQDVPVLVEGAPWVDKVAAAVAVEARGDADAAAALRDEGFGEAPDTPGVCDGKDFTWIADADPRFGPTFEAIIAGRWGLVAFASVRAFVSDGPQDLRDMVWLPVQIAFRSGQSAAAFIPARYPGSEAGDAAVRLGRRTDWTTNGGLGQRLWSFDADEDVGLLSFRKILFQ